MHLRLLDQFVKGKFLLLWRQWRGLVFRAPVQMQSRRIFFSCNFGPRIFFSKNLCFEFFIQVLKFFFTFSRFFSGQELKIRIFFSRIQTQNFFLNNLGPDFFFVEFLVQNFSLEKFFLRILDFKHFFSVQFRAKIFFELKFVFNFLFKHRNFFFNIFEIFFWPGIQNQIFLFSALPRGDYLYCSIRILSLEFFFSKTSSKFFQKNFGL